MKRMPSWPRAMNAAAKAFLPGLLLLVATRGALAESASQAPPQSPPWTATESSPTPTGPATFPQNALTASAPVDFPPSVPPAATRPAPLGSRPGPLHGAIIPALETRVDSRPSPAFLHRTTEFCTRACVTKQYTVRVGGRSKCNQPR